MARLPWVGLAKIFLKIRGVDVTIPDETERRAARALHVELVTRGAVPFLTHDQKLVREVLNSFQGSSRVYARSYATLAPQGVRRATPWGDHYLGAE
jgi:hypothetical protein